MEWSCSISGIKQTARMVTKYGQSGAISLSKHVYVTHLALHVYYIVLHAFPVSFDSHPARHHLPINKLAERAPQQRVIAYAGELLQAKRWGTSELPIHRKFRARVVASIAEAPSR
jgi:hypothetical protein